MFRGSGVALMQRDDIPEASTLAIANGRELIAELRGIRASWTDRITARSEQSTQPRLALTRGPRCDRRLRRTRRKTWLIRRRRHSLPQPLLQRYRSEVSRLVPIA